MPLDFSSPSVTIGGVPCFDEDTRETFGVHGREARRILVCQWNHRITVTRALMGGVASNGVIVTVTPPAAYPDEPSLTCKEVAPEGVGLRGIGPNGMVGYEYARLTATYTAEDVTTAELSIDFRSDILTVPQDAPSFKWGDDEPLPPEASPPLLVGSTDFVITRHLLASIPESLIESLRDHVNTGTFRGRPAGTVRFVGARSRRQYTTITAPTYSITFVFASRKEPWNNFLRPSTGLWEPVYLMNGQPPFPGGDLNRLLA